MDRDQPVCAVARNAAVRVAIPISMPNARQSRSDLIVLGALCGFLFFYGLGAFGLVGADEPRYAQVAREMLERHDWITPTLGHVPWLEKPVLLYWEQMAAFSIFGVSDWAARLPSAFSAAAMIVAIYLFLRRFRPGSEMDGALMTASSAAVIGFARAAATDMPLAANFSIAMLAWYAWRESGERRWLLACYGFLGLATLAKGPVGVGLFGLIVLMFAAAHGNWQRFREMIAGTLWWPGIVAFLVVTLPWFIAVQLRNPEFFRVFILEHNLARFGTNLYRHQQPFWYYVPVALVGLLPWIVFVIASVMETIRGWKGEGKAVFESKDSFDVFLLLWFTVPIVFFSIAQSKLPGYILPALPAGALLVASFVRRHSGSGEVNPSAAGPAGKIPLFLHSLLASILLIPAILIRYLVLVQRLPWGIGTLVACIVAMIFTIGIFLALRSRYGLGLLRVATLVPVVLAVGLILRQGGAALDEQDSARTIAASLAKDAPVSMPVAVFQVNRQTEYGLHFYRNQPVSNYDRGEIPTAAHLLVAKEGTQHDLGQAIGSRSLKLLGSNSAQHLEYYRVSAR